jgi:hypothetical protein
MSLRICAQNVAETLFEKHVEAKRLKGIFEASKIAREKLCMSLEDFTAEYTNARVADHSPQTIAAGKLALRLLGEVVGSKIRLDEIIAEKFLDFRAACIPRRKKRSECRSIFTCDMKTALKAVKKQNT